MPRFRSFLLPLLTAHAFLSYQSVAALVPRCHPSRCQPLCGRGATPAVSACEIITGEVAQEGLAELHVKAD